MTDGETSVPARRVGIGSRGFFGIVRAMTGPVCSPDLSSRALPSGGRTRRFARVGPVVLAFAVALSPLVATSARAQSSGSTSTQARALFREARKLMDKGKFEEACPKLEASLRLDDGMGTRFNLAHCLEKIGRTASAWGLFLDVASAASAAGQKKRERAARQRAEALEPELARVTIEVPHPVPGLVVTRGGEAFAPESWGTSIPVDLGVQRVEASAEGRLPWSEEVAIDTPGASVSVVVPELQLEHVEPPPEEPLAIQPSNGERDVTHDSGGISSGRLVTTSVLAALGVGGLAVGAVYGLKVNSETDAARALCVGGESGTVCDRDRAAPDFDRGQAESDEREEHRSNARRAATMSYIGWGVGAASLIGATIVLLTAPGEAGGAAASEADSARFRVEPLLGSGELGATLRTRF